MGGGEKLIIKLFIEAIIPILAFLGTVAIAIATWMYTIYSKATINELKKQNLYLKQRDVEEYRLYRKSICYKLIDEINMNIYTADFLLDSIYFEEKCLNEWDKDKLKKYFLNDEREFSYFIIIAKGFTKSEYGYYKAKDITFKNDKIMIEINNLYSFFDLLFIKIEELNNKHKRGLFKTEEEIFKYLNSIKNNIKTINDIKDELFKNLKKEIDLDFEVFISYVKYEFKNK